jgi:glycosidase
MFTFRGIPCVYYGTEIQFKAGAPCDIGTTGPLSGTGRAYFGDNITGSVTVSDFGVWSGATGNMATTLNSPLAKHLSRLNRIRRAIPALQMGQYSTSDVSGGIAFKRRYTSSTIDSFCLVTISGSATFYNIPNGTYVDAVTGTTINVGNNTLTANCSGQGNMRVYVLTTSLTPAPGKIGDNTAYLY